MLSFETQLLLFAAVIPCMVAVFGTAIFCQLQRRIPIHWLRWYSLSSLVVWLIGFSVSRSRSSVFAYAESNSVHKLPWFVLFAVLVGVLCSNRKDFEQQSWSDKQKLNSGIWCLIRCTLFCVAAWWLIPKGKGWEDTADWQPFWLLMAGLGTAWNGWSMAAVRERGVASGNQSEPKDLGDKALGWQLWIGIGAILGVAALAGLSVASLAECLITIASIAIGISSMIHFGSRKLLAKLGELGVAAAISGGTVLAMAYPSSSVPKFIYIAMMLVPVLVSLADELAYRSGCKPLLRLLCSFVVTAILVGGMLGWALINEPVEQW